MQNLVQVKKDVKAVETPKTKVNENIIARSGIVPKIFGSNNMQVMKTKSVIPTPACRKNEVKALDGGIMKKIFGH